MLNKSQSKDIKEEVDRDGFTIVRSLLSSIEVDRLRITLLKHFKNSWKIEGLGKHQPNAAVEIPAIGWVFSHPPILDVFRVICSEPLLFTGNCDAHANMLSHWHKDLSEKHGGCFSADCFSRKTWSVYRAGIYLQDHVVQHGLSVRVGSHRARSLADGEARTLSTRAGDVIFFDMRLTHAGQFADPIENALLRVGRKLRREPQAAAIKDRYRTILKKADKFSVFFTYGSDSPEGQEMCEFELMMKARFAEDRQHLDPALVDALKQAGVGFHPALVRSATDFILRPS